MLYYKTLDNIDMHLHTTASDGTLSPAELVRHAKENGLTKIAVTDHDTISGLSEAKLEADKLGLELIYGIEISADFIPEMHILGYEIDVENKNLASAIKTLKLYRRDRNFNAVKNIIESGINITHEEILRKSPDGTYEGLGRVHIAQVLYEKGYASSIKSAFTKYLSANGGIFYSPKQKFSPKECIGIINGAGGKAVLAHPYFIYKDDYDKLFSLLQQLKGYGLYGVEVYYSEHSGEYIKRVSDMCDELMLHKTAGSDFHGGTKPHIPIGHTNFGEIGGGGR